MPPPIFPSRTRHAPGACHPVLMRPGHRHSKRRGEIPRRRWCCTCHMSTFPLAGEVGPKARVRGGCWRMSGNELPIMRHGRPTTIPPTVLPDAAPPSSSSRSERSAGPEPGRHGAWRRTEEPPQIQWLPGPGLRRRLALSRVTSDAERLRPRLRRSLRRPGVRCRCHVGHRRTQGNDRKTGNPRTP